MLRPSQGATAWGEVALGVALPSTLTELPARLLIREDWKGLMLHRERDCEDYEVN